MKQILLILLCLVGAKGKAQDTPGTRIEIDDSAFKIHIDSVYGKHIDWDSIPQERQDTIVLSDNLYHRWYSQTLDSVFIEPKVLYGYDVVKFIRRDGTVSSANKKKYLRAVRKYYSAIHKQ